MANNEVLLAAVNKPLGQACSNIDVIELLSFRNKSLLADGLNAKHPIWNS